MLAAIDKIIQKYGNNFQFNLYVDKSFSGRLEMTLFLNKKIDRGEGFLIWSKEMSKKFPHEDFSTLLSQVRDCLDMSS